MEQIPDALLEAAKIDGASEYRIFWTIVMPQCQAGLADTDHPAVPDAMGHVTATVHLQRAAEDRCIMRQVRLFRAESPGQERGCGSADIDECADHAIYFLAEPNH